MTANKKKIPKDNVIPRASASGALTVIDGTVTVGSIVARDGSFFAFDADGILLGKYSTQGEAMRSIPERCLAVARSGSDA
jgi:outer membrane protein assembly factor BamB